MTPERWQELTARFEAALDRPAADRESFVRRTCADDESLRRRVGTLLVAHGRASAFLETSAISIEARALADDLASSVRPAQDHIVGRRVAHYDIVERIADGGMGVVYKAVDTRLDRFVAVKFLCGATAHTTDALVRFRREARAASALSHPNICTVHDLGDDNGRAFIVMEYLEGETLRQRLERGPLDQGDLISLALEIVDGLEAAHAAGIVHRDIKPGNLFLTRAQHAKILDFGLAQLTSDVGRQEPLTRDGVIVGTAGYMAPEQAAGEPLDARADLFAFGLVLSEMTTGIRGVTGSRRQVEPAALERLIAGCLEHDRERRVQRASDIRAALRELQQATGPCVPSPEPRMVDNRIVHRWLPATAGLVICGLLAYAAVGRWSQRATTALTALTARDTIVTADFTNTTGDPVFDGVLRQALAVELEQSPFLKLVSDDRIRHDLQSMGRPAHLPLAAELAREVCTREGSAAVVTGSIAPLGTHFVLGLRATSCSSGAVLSDEQGQAASKEDVLNVLSRLSTSFRRRLGESLVSVEQHSVPLRDATAASMDALKAYTTAMTVWESSGAAKATPLLKRAVEIDPGFAIAHANLGIAYSNLGESARSIASTIRAYELREHVNDPERFFITTMYHRQVTGNLEKEQETLQTWARTYSRDPAPHGLLAGFALTGTGQYDRSIAEAQQAIALDPNHGAPYASLAFSQLYLDRLDAALDTARSAAGRNRDFTEFALARYFVALLRSDRVGMERELHLSAGQPGTEDMLAHVDGLTSARAGRLHAARKSSRLAADLARQTGASERAALFEAGAAVTEAFVGDMRTARLDAARALTLSHGRDVEFPVAFALALSGDSHVTRTLTDDLDRRFPEDTSVRFNYLPALRGLIALKAGHPRQAIGELENAEHLELAVPGVAYNGFFGAMYPVYVRGMAYLAARQPTEALAQFQKILAHRGLVLGDPMDAVARLQLARAFMQSGDTAQAKAAYEDVLNLWKDADADLPILMKARSEYAQCCERHRVASGSAQ